MSKRAEVVLVGSVLGIVALLSAILVVQIQLLRAVPPTRADLLAAEPGEERRILARRVPIIDGYVRIDGPVDVAQVYQPLEVY